MTDKIKELESQLAQAKKEKIRGVIEAKLEQVSHYMGKFYISHLFYKSKSFTLEKLHTYLSKGRTVSIYHIKDVVWKQKWSCGPAIDLDKHELNENYISEHYMPHFLVDVIILTNSTNDDCINISRKTDEYVIERDIRSMYNTHEISARQFNQIWKSVEDAQESIYSRIGIEIADDIAYRSTNEISSVVLENIGCKFIELSSSEDYLLSGKIPLIWQGKLWVCEQSLILLRKEALRLRKIIANTKNFIYGHEFISADTLSATDRQHLDVIDDIIQRVEKVMKDDKMR